MLLLPLLLEAALLRLASGSHHPFYNGFYYNHLMNDNGNGQEKGILGTGRAGGKRGWQVGARGCSVPSARLGDGAGTRLLGGMLGPGEQAGML